MCNVTRVLASFPSPADFTNPAPYEYMALPPHRRSSFYTLHPPRDTPSTECYVRAVKCPVANASAAA